MEGWSVEPMTAADLDDVLEIEGVSFTNPWTRPMFERELLDPGVSHLYVLRTGEVGARGTGAELLARENLFDTFVGRGP